MSQRSFPPPMKRLITEIRAAARQIDCAPAREKAAREASRIELTGAERLPNAVRGEMARRARAILKSLPTLPVEDYGHTAAALIGLADGLAVAPMRATKRGEAA